MSPTRETIHYAITITFRPEFTIKDKLKLINKLPKYLLGKDLYWERSIEYHKYHMRHPKQGLDNPCSPHVHMYLTMEDTVSRRNNIDCMKMNFQRLYGRPDIQVLHSNEDIDLWRIYIQKDNVRNNEAYPTINHFLRIPDVIQEI